MSCERADLSMHVRVGLLGQPMGSGDQLGLQLRMLACLQVQLVLL